MSILPLCHIAERTFSVFLALHYRWVVNFVEAPDTSFENTMEVSPTVFFGVPRMWEKMYSGVVIKIKEAIWLGRFAYDWAVGVGERYEEAREENSPSAVLRAQRWLAEKLVFHNLKVMLGLDRARIMFTGAAPVAPDLIRWYRAIGLDLYELYGQTECSGITSSNRDGANRLGSIGQAVPHVEMKIAEDGEILVRGDLLMKGYWRDPATTAGVIKDGWLYTGDLGSVDEDGFVTITGRKKDIIVNSGGENIAPGRVEALLAIEPEIEQVMVDGDHRPWLAGVIVPSDEARAKAASDNDLKTLIAEAVDRANTRLSQIERVRRFVIAKEAFSTENSQLTPTLKVRRHIVRAAYADQLDALYKRR